jgi:hypothetical protein
MFQDSHWLLMSLVTSTMEADTHPVILSKHQKSGLNSCDAAL